MKRQMFIESAVLSVPQLAESENGGKWEAQVWKLDQVNLNGRIYSTELAKRIVQLNKVTLAYDGHDADWKSGNEYGCAKAVCKNPRIESNALVVDIEFVDKAFEKNLKLIASMGVPIGVSSCGYGEVDESGMVIPESYELVRYLDFVTAPAGGVYANQKEEKGKNPMGDLSAEAVARRSRLSKDITDLIF